MTPRVESMRPSRTQGGDSANEMALALSGKAWTLEGFEGPQGQRDEVVTKQESLGPGSTKILRLTDKNSDRLAEDLIQDTFQALPVKPKRAFAQERPEIECEYLGENEEGDVVVEMTVTQTITATFDSETCKKAACHNGSIERPSYKPAELPAPEEPSVEEDRERTVRIGEVQESGTSGGSRHDSYQSSLDMDRTLSDMILEPVAGADADSASPPCLKPYSCKDLGCEWMVDAGKVHLNRRLAVGGFAEVFLGQYEGTRVAVKRLFAQSNQDEFRREVRLLAGLRHPNLLLFMGYTLYPSLSIITEYMQRGSLYNILEKHRGEGPLELKLQRSVALSVARGMAYLHSRSPPILHLDLKSANILVDNAWRVKLGDFGLSRIRTNSFMSSAASAGGTPQWMAPEVLRSERYDEAADVYSFGVVLWEVLTGEGPWADMHAMQVVGAVGFQGRTLPRPTSPQADEFLVDLCMACMHPVASRRPLFPTIVDAMDLQFNRPIGPSSSAASSLYYGDGGSEPAEKSLQPSTRTAVSGASSGPIQRSASDADSADEDERVIIRALSEESALKAQQASTSSSTKEDLKLYGLFREPSAKSPFDSAASLAGVREGAAKPGLDVDSPFLQEMASPVPQQQQEREPSVASPFLQQTPALDRQQQQQQREPPIASPFLQETAGPAPQQQQQRAPSIASPFLQETAAPAPQQQQERAPSIASPFLQETATPVPQQQQERAPSIASPFLQETAGHAPQQQQQRAPSIASPFLQETAAPAPQQHQQREPSIASPFLQETAGPAPQQQQQRAPSIASPFLQETPAPAPQQQQQRAPSIASPFLQETPAPAPQQQQERAPSIASPFLQETAGHAPQQQQQRAPSIASPFLQETAAPAPQQQQERASSIASPFLQDIAAPAPQQQQERASSIASPFLQETATPGLREQQQQREPSIASPFLQETAAPNPQQQEREPSIASPFLQETAASVSALLLEEGLEAGLAVLETKLAQGVRLQEHRLREPGDHGSSSADNQRRSEEGAASLAAVTSDIISGDTERPPSGAVTSPICTDRSANASSELRSEMSDEIDICRWVSVKFEHGDMIVGTDGSKATTSEDIGGGDGGSNQSQLDGMSTTPARKGSSCRVKHTLAWLAGLNKSSKSSSGTHQGKSNIEK